MKKILFLLVLGGYTQFSMAQCTCGACSAPVGLAGAFGDGPVTLSDRGIQAEFTTEWRKFDIPAALDAPEGIMRLQNAAITTAAISYGINRKLLVSAVQPYAVMNAAAGSTTGFADLMIMGRYIAVSRPSFKASLSAGLELPTGSGTTGSLVTPVVLGSSSFDPLAGAAFAIVHNNLSINSRLFYKHSTLNGDAMRFSDSFTHGIAVSYRIGKENNDRSDTLKRSVASSSLSISLGASGEWAGSQVRSHVILAPGGYAAYLAASLQLTINRWSFPLSAELPLYRTGDRSQQASYKLRLGLVYSLTLN